MGRINDTLSEWSGRERDIAARTAPTLTIGSDAPILCSMARCAMASRQITDSVEYIMVKTSQGLIIAHLACIGIKHGPLESADYQKHIANRVVATFNGH